ncbi:MAG: hypothetical protein ACRYFU_10765 [Janthinobacterium lividum]
MQNDPTTLPYKAMLSTRMNGNGDQHYKLTTGFDNNADGKLNDRPVYASPDSIGTVSTKYGLLTAIGGDAGLRRNEGILPWKFYVDANLQRPFSIDSGCQGGTPAGDYRKHPFRQRPEPYERLRRKVEFLGRPFLPCLTPQIMGVE